MESTSQNTDRTLLCVAAEVEASAVFTGVGADTPPLLAPWRLHRLGPVADLLMTGVGKANAAGAVVHALRAGRHARVINLGIAGALPGSGLHLGDAVAATASVFADEGLAAPGGFVDLAEMGFPLSPFPATHDDPHALPPDPELFKAARAHTDAQGPVACVSTCSGTDELAAAIAARTGCVAEAMEGAAVAFALHNLRGAGAGSAAFLELRVISNTTGRRDRQRWDIALALERLALLAGAIVG